MKNHRPNKLYRLRPLILTTFFAAIAGVLVAYGWHAAAQETETRRPSLSRKGGGVYNPTQRQVVTNPPINFADAAMTDSFAGKEQPREIEAAPDHDRMPPKKSMTVPIAEVPAGTIEGLSPSGLSASGSSPIPAQTFAGEKLNGTTIPSDTMGAVGESFVMTTTNNMLTISDRSGAQVTRQTVANFWTGVTIKGVAVTSAFDTKVYYDKYNSRFILIASGNLQSVSSGALFAVSQTSDPTGVWNRYSVAADPASTVGGGHWIDYPSVGFNKNWIIISENVFNFGTAGSNTYYGQQVYVMDKQAAYSNTLSSISLFEAAYTTTCVSPFIDKLGCGFTMAPAVVEDNVTEGAYLVEDWDPTAGQLRVSKLTGTPSAPTLTVGTQFPQSPYSWRTDASRLNSSGGYLPQRNQSTNTSFSQRIMANDSRVQNAVYRNGSVWAVHTVMVAATNTAAGTGFGAANPDIRSVIQWWQIDPTVETQTSAAPIQRGRIEDPLADNCHNGVGGTRTTGTCTSTAAQVGRFYAFPNISVNKDNDVLIGFSQFSPVTYASAAYALRRSSDPAGIFRDPVIYRPGQSSYNIGGGSGSARQNRWGDYSASQIDPVNDTDFWTIQEYSGTYRDFGIGLAAPWETWWAQVNPASAAPIANGNLIISELRFRGPQGARDEFIELFNPGPAAVLVNTSDNSDGWAVASNNGTTTTILAVIPNGTIIPAGGYFLLADNPDGSNGPTVTYSLGGYSANGVRGADSDLGFHNDIPDTGGIAIFKTSTAANFSASTVMDAVGFASLPAGSLFKEGNGIPTDASFSANNQFALVRTESGGAFQDAAENETDFRVVDINGTSFGSAGQRLGAPAPQNLSSGFYRGALLPVSLIDSSVSATSAPNQVVDATPGDPNTSSNGTVSFRRTVVNSTNSPVTFLRFRVTSLSTFPNPGGTADLRLISSTSQSVSTNDAAVCGGLAPCSVTANALTFETPPNQANGGGINSTVRAGVITLANPLAPGARVNVNLVFGIQQSGTMSFAVDAEGVAVGTLSPTAAPVIVSGRVTSAAGYGVSGAVVTATDRDGVIHSSRTNTFGLFTITDLTAGESYLFRVTSKGFTFTPRLMNVQQDLSSLDFIGRER
jgi:hypothetical protein